MPSNPRTPPRQNTAGEALTMLLIALLCIALTLVWSSAELAMLLFKGHFFPVSKAVVLEAVLAIPHHWGDPSAAWPAPYSTELPGGADYWSAFALELVGAALLLVGGLAVVRRLRGASGSPRPTSLDRQERAGVMTQGQFATRRDLRPLFARRPLHGRFLLGRVGRRLLATQPPNRQGRGRRRATSSGAVGIVGPSRSGKTLLANAAVRSWDGPAILVSLKTDVLEATYDARAALGEARVFDPAGVTTYPSARWSPLASASTTDGAMRAARALIEAAPRDARSVSKGRFWNDMAESLLAGLMTLAANTAGRSFDDVVRRVVSVDTPSEERAGEVAPLLRACGAIPTRTRGTRLASPPRRSKGSGATTTARCPRCTPPPAQWCGRGSTRSSPARPPPRRSAPTGCCRGRAPSTSRSRLPTRCGCDRSSGECSTTSWPRSSTASCATTPRSSSRC